MRWNALVVITLSKRQLFCSSWNTPQHFVLKAKSSTSFKPVRQTSWVYQDSGTQLSSLWDLGLQWRDSPNGGPCSQKMMLCFQLLLQANIARQCAKHEATEMNAPALRSSVQCISLIRSLEAVCINKHHALSLQNGLGSLWAGHWITTDNALDLVLHMLSESVPQSHYSHSF